MGGGVNYSSPRMGKSNFPDIIFYKKQSVIFGKSIIRKLWVCRGPGAASLYSNLFQKES